MLVQHLHYCGLRSVLHLARRVRVSLRSDATQSILYTWRFERGVAGQEGKAIAFMFSARTIADDCQLEVESSVEYGVCAVVV